MLATTFLGTRTAQKALPYLWGFATAAALDHVFDIQYAFPFALLGLAVVSASRRAGR